MPVPNRSDFAGFAIPNPNFSTVELSINILGVEPLITVPSQPTPPLAHHQVPFQKPPRSGSNVSAPRTGSFKAVVVLVSVLTRAKHTLEWVDRKAA